MELNIGIDKSTRTGIAEGLNKALANTYALYLKTQVYHWNVTGPLFKTVHDMTEEQYTELATAADDIAERIRALGFKAPGGLGSYGKLSDIDDATAEDAEDMVRDLVAGHEVIIRHSRELLGKAAEADDETTVDLLTGRLAVHEKTAWMLRSLLPDAA